MSAGSRRIDGLALVLVVALCVPALWPLLSVPAWQSHDGLHHIFRIAAFVDGLRGGELYPRWADGLGFGYGFPVTHYYAPLAYYLVAALNLGGISILDGIKLAYALGIIATALGMFLFARRTLGPIASLVAAVAYAYYPYHLADITMRGTLTEFMALALLPPLAWSAERIAEPAAARLGGRIVVFALLLAALVLTHNLTAFLFLPALALYLLLRFWPAVRRAPLRMLGGWFAGVALGFALAAFYWLPALGETAWIRAGQASGGVDDMPSLLTPLAQFVSGSLIQIYQPDAPAQLQHPLGLVVALAAVVAIVACGARWRLLDEPVRRTGLAWGAVALVALFAMSELSSAIWSVLRPLSLVQFPFRLHAVLGLALAWLIGAGVDAFQRASLPRPVLAVAGAFAVVLIVISPLGALSLSAQSLPGHKEPLDASQINVTGMSEYDYQTALWTRLYGGVWLFEYMPAWVTEAREEFFLPHAVAPAVSLPLAATVAAERYAPEVRVLRVNTSVPFRLSFHAFYFPPWMVRVDGIPAPVYPSGALALASADMPAGEHQVTLEYDGTVFSTFGAWLSLGALLALCGIVFISHRRAGVALVVLLGLGASTWLWQASAAQAAYVVQPVQATFDSQISLIGYRTDRASYHPGDTADVTLYWFARRAPTENFKVFVHLDAAAGRAGQADGQPGLNFSPTTRWQAGEIIADPYRVRIAQTAKPGAYDLLAGMYRTQPVQNLPVESAAATPDNRVRLGTLEIVSP
ncbi:MAG: hypothetical protein HZB53_01750 [Chloroflexi bacterium]|nr:hypothetical protein [Chloroflexota bacterium]